MCGIAGAIGFDRETNTQLVKQIVADQWRRGPDCQATEQIDDLPVSIVLGHDRLAIIDTTSASNQPMWNAERTCCVVYNGEIYNYKELREELRGLGHDFHTNGDVEVLLRAYLEWGLDFPNHLNGMFAFGLYDQKLKRLILVRDRFAVKPLYYAEGKGELAFASTPTVLADHFACRPNLRYIQQGIDYRVYEDNTDQAPYEGMKSLPGGCLAVVTATSGSIKVETQRYYDLYARVPGKIDEVASMNEGNLVEALLETLRSAAALRMRADVPVALSLSGGLDSSSVAAVLSEGEYDLRGYCFGDPQDSSTEGPLVQEMANKGKYPVTYVSGTTDEFRATLDRVLDDQAAPFSTISILAQSLVYQAAARDGIKVLLGGQGGDEALMGYRKFLFFRMRDLLDKRDLFGALGFLAQTLPSMLSEGSRLAHYSTRISAYKDGQAAAGNVVEFDSEAPTMSLNVAKKDPLWKRSASDVLHFSLPTLLRYEDRNSMAYSIESRLPYLDYRLIELSLALPTALKISHGYGKYAMRLALKGHIPESIRMMRRKYGFEADSKSIISKGLGQDIRNRLHACEVDFRPALKAPVDIDSTFADNALLQRSKAFGEAMSLLWLGKRMATGPALPSGNAETAGV